MKTVFLNCNLPLWKRLDLRALLWILECGIGAVTQPLGWWLGKPEMILIQKNVRATGPHLQYDYIGELLFPSLLLDCHMQWLDCKVGIRNSQLQGLNWLVIASSQLQSLKWSRIILDSNDNPLELTFCSGLEELDLGTYPGNMDVRTLLYLGFLFLEIL